MAALFMVDVGDGLVVPHTPEERERLWRGVDRELAMTLGSPLFDGTAPDYEDHVMGPGKP